MPRKREIVPKQAPLKGEHTVTISPRLWERLGEIASRHYGGSRSKAVEGLALHDWMLEKARAVTGQGPMEHWICAPLVTRSGELEPTLRRMEADPLAFTA